MALTLLLQTPSIPAQTFPQLFLSTWLTPPTPLPIKGLDFCSDASLHPHSVVAQPSLGILQTDHFPSAASYGCLYCLVAHLSKDTVKSSREQIVFCGSLKPQP